MPPKRNRPSSVEALLADQKLHEALAKNGLSIQRVAWEDTGRSPNSCFGPNIADMTLRVLEPRTNAQTHTHAIDAPMIRTHNFKDVTTDLEMSKIKLTVGNEKEGTEKKVITLAEYLEKAGHYTANDKIKSLLKTGEDKVLAVAQCCVLPLKDGAVEFVPAIYSYQTY